MDRSKLLFAALLGCALLLGVLIGSDRRAEPQPGGTDMDLMGVQGALITVARAIDRTVTAPEAERWFQTTDGSIKVWPREGEPVTIHGDRVRATYYHAGHLLLVETFAGTSDRASQHEYFVEPLRWVRVPR